MNRTVTSWLAMVAISSASLGAAQLRPAPQAPRRPATEPRATAPPKRGTSEPAEAKETPPPKPVAAPAPGTPATQADAGAELFRKNGCYECHANDAQGGPQGPRLGPNPVALPRFLAYVRNPAGDMPPFTAKVISDADLRSIYAFLQSRPIPPPVANIPLLAP
jgi:mono/diheme cytochrome c family protein